MVSKSKPIRLLLAVAAGSTALAGGLPLITPDDWDWTGPAIGLLGLVLTVAVGKYTEDNTTPWEDVAAKVTPEGEVVAGPAAVQRTGSTVEVVKPDAADPLAHDAPPNEEL